MYRGIIQHKTYLTPYLKNEIKERDLTKPLNCGRIYKIVPQKKNLKKVQIPTDTSGLLNLLKHPNGWLRNQAQQLLIDGKYITTAPILRSYLNERNKPLQLIHALWTLEGLGVLQLNDVLPLLNATQWPIRMQALSIVPSIISKTNYRQLLPVLQQMVNRNDTLAAPYI